MKKIFAKLKELASKIVNKAKDIWAKVKEWLNKEDDKGTTNKTKIKVWGWLSAMTACSITLGYCAGGMKVLTSEPVKNALDWYNNPESERLRTSGFHKLSTRKRGAGAEEYSDGITAYKWDDGYDYIDMYTPQGIEAAKLSDFGNVGERIIAMGYSPDQKVYSGDLLFGACNYV